jgi:hypothetical protein
MAGQTLSGFEARLTSAAALWRHSACFAEVRAKKDCIAVAFASSRRHDEWEAAKVLQISKNRYIHYFEVRDGTDFSILAERIAAACVLTKSAKPPKREEDTADCQSIDAYIARFPHPRRGSGGVFSGQTGRLPYYQRRRPVSLGPAHTLRTHCRDHPLLSGAE